MSKQLRGFADGGTQRVFRQQSGAYQAMTRLCAEFESGGLSLAHALLRGLTAMPALAPALHGEMVAYGSLVQLCLEARGDEERCAHAAWLVRLGLPVTAAQLGAALSPQEQRQVAELTMNAPYIGHFERALTAGDISHAMVAAERFGQAALG